MRAHEYVPAIELRSNRSGARSANARSGPHATASKKIRNYPSEPTECGINCNQVELAATGGNDDAILEAFDYDCGYES